MPPPDKAKPSVIMKEKDPHKELVPYPVKKVLELWKQRGPYADPELPPVFQSDSDVLDTQSAKIGRDRLVLKPRNVKELMYYTMNDE
jgi:hypothetical protein